MSDWTLRAIKARGMALEAYCPGETCRRFYAFNLDTLIESVGADFKVADIPPLDCAHCGARLDIKLAMLPPEDAVG